MSISLNICEVLQLMLLVQVPTQLGMSVHSIEEE